MTTNGNDIEIDISKNDALKEYFSRKELGHVCTFEVKFQLNEKTENAVKGSLKKIAYESEGKESETEPMANQPVVVMMKPAREKKEPADGGY